MTMKLMRAAALVPLGAALGVLAAVVQAGPASAASGDCVTVGKLTTCTFTFTGGAQTWTVPAGIHSATFTLYGAEGGTAVGGIINSVPVPGAVGGLGADVTGTLAVTPGTVLQVNVGQAGGSGTGATFGGGGSGGITGGAGGGASDVRSPAGGYYLADRLLVAGGGGGGGDNQVASPGSGLNIGLGGPGGNADSPGANGQPVTIPGATIGGGGGGGAGTTTAGGSAGAAGVITGTDTCPSGTAPGTAGAVGTLGIGAGFVIEGAGAGGGGYYGGGSGGGPADDGCLNLPGWGGGGGGASYTGTATGASVIDGVLAPDDSPNGEVIITFHKGK